MSDEGVRELLVELLRDFHRRGVGVRHGRRHLRTGRRRRPPARADGRPQGTRPDRRVLHGRPDRRARRSGPPSGPISARASATRSSASAQRARAAWSVVHSHALSAVLAGDLVADAGADHLAIRDLEMLKGIPGVDATRDVHLVPVIRNTPREPELVEPARAASSPTRASPRRTRSSCATTAPTSGAPTCWTPSATPRSTTSCSRPRSRGATARRRIDDDRRRRTAEPHSRPAAHLTQDRRRRRRHGGRGRQADRGRRVQADVPGHGTQSSVFVFQGHPGPFRTPRPRRPTTRSATCWRARARSRSAA